MSEEEEIEKMRIRESQLKKLRDPFSDEQINKLPRPTISNEEWKKLPKAKCPECGGYHPVKNTIHLDYVGHAALTNRLLDVDPHWFWEPIAFKDGLPAFDGNGGLWIRLTICGMSRIGYGNATLAAFRTIGDREKEVIGDALRNAAMRFGAALGLWHKGDLHIEDADDSIGKEAKKVVSDVPDFTPPPQSLTTKTYIKRIEAKSGVKRDGKPYKIYGITCDDDAVYKTFSETFADIANTAKTSGDLVTIAYQEGRLGKNLIGITIEENTVNTAREPGQEG